MQAEPQSEHRLAEFVCTLQPRAGSTLAARLARCREACQDLGLGLDETSLYPPHITVTGFFRASGEQAARICDLAVALATSAGFAAKPELDGSREEAEGAKHIDLTEGRGDVQLLRVLSTDTGYVIADVFAPRVSRLAEELAQRSSRDLGVLLRPKAVKHISLASGRGPEEQARIVHIYGAQPLGGGPWDLVVSKLVARSDLACLRRGGQMHQFEDILRLPLPSAGGDDDGSQLGCQAPAALHERIAQSCDAAQAIHKGAAEGRRAEGCVPFFPTPMKRRSRGLLTGDMCSDEQITPPFKLTRRRSQPQDTLAK